ncbi:MAG: protein-export chaperone SecB [Sphaerochaeta sp.]|nr:protein-export chaperone SecB [Sphaerochaeta sp.]
MSEKGDGKASLQMLSYKVDKVRLDVVPKVNILIHSTDIIDSEQFKYSISVREPRKIKEEGSTIYIGGVNVTVDLVNKDDSKENIAHGEFGITGLFLKHGTDLTTVQEEAIVKYNIPSILLSYLRSVITSLFANAGLGLVIFPLINMKEVVEDQKIRIIDIDSSGVELSGTNR